MTTRRSGRVNHEDGGIPLPPAHNEFYGENNEIAANKGGQHKPIAEDENNSANVELYNAAFGLSAGQKSRPQVQTRQSTRNPVNQAIENIYQQPEPQRSSQGPSQRPNPFIPPTHSRDALPRNLQPFSGDPWNLRDERGNRNLYQSELLNPYQTPYKTGRHPSEPPNSLTSKWGMAAGRATPYPLSNRSFNHEDRLFTSANLQSPLIQPPPESSAQQNRPGNGLRGDPVQQNRERKDTVARSSSQTSGGNTSDVQSTTSTQQSTTERATVEKPEVQQPSIQKPEVRQLENRRSTSASHVPQSSIPSPVPQSPIQQTPSQQAPIQQTPSQQAPIQQSLTQRSPVQSSSGKTASTNGSKKPFMDESSKQRLGDRMRYERPEPEQVSKPWTSRDRMTAQELTQAEALRNRMRLDEGPVNRGPPWTKPNPPPHAEISSRKKADATPAPDPKEPQGQEKHQEPQKPQEPRVQQQQQEQHHQQQKARQQQSEAPRAQRKSEEPQVQQDPQRPQGQRLPAQPAGPSAFSRLLSRIRDVAAWTVATAARLSWLWLSVLLLAILASQALKYSPNNSLSSPTSSASFPSPNFSMPTFSSLLPSWGRSDSKLKDIFNRLDGIDLDLTRIHSILDQVKAGVTPVNDGRQVFWVEKDKNGKLVIPQDYYEAIKQQILKDKQLLRGVSSDTLSPLVSRLVSEGYLKKPSGAKDLSYDDITSDDINSAWSLWVRQNDAAIVKALRGELSKTVSELTERDLKELLKKHNIDQTNGNVVTRQEFEGLYKKEIKSGYGDQLRKLAGQVDDFKEDMKRLRANPPKDLSEADMDGIIHAAIHKYTDDLKIEAAAKAGSSIVLSELTNKLNFFTQGAGATIDPHVTSKKWKPPRRAHASEQWYDKDGYIPQPASIAFMPWDDEGECFCAGPGLPHELPGTSSIAAVISREIVPEYLVVEHLLPGATLDAGARPRDMEIWARFEDYDLRNTVEAWSRSLWPDTESESAMHDGFVKIGGFTYEQHKIGDGTQPYKFLSELATMNAASDHYVVRAMNNYGADHTCFYRLRLYGEKRARRSGI